MGLNQIGGEEEFGRDWIGLLVVGVEGGIVHEPLQAAGVCDTAVESKLDVEIYQKVRFRDSRKWEQWHGHGEIILEHYLRVSFAIIKISLRSDLRCSSDSHPHITPRLMSVSCSCLLPHSISRLRHGSGNGSGRH